MSTHFSPGRVVATPRVLQALQEAGQLPDFFLDRHIVGDWGDVFDNDKQANDEALLYGKQLLSAYNTLPGVRSG